MRFSIFRFPVFDIRCTIRDVRHVMRNVLRVAFDVWHLIFNLQSFVLSKKTKVDGETAKVGSFMHGNTFKLALSNWETWMVFTSESVTWELSSKGEVKVCTSTSCLVLRISISRV